MPQSDGSLFKVNRPPILHDNACPYFLLNCPTYFSSDPTSTKPKRLDPVHKDFSHFTTALQYSEEDYSLEEKKFAVKSFDDVKSKLIDYNVPSDWLIWYSNPT